MNRKEGTIVGLLLLATFITGAFAVPEQQILNVFVTNFPDKSHVGQSVTDHVALICNDIVPHEELFCARVLADGTHTAGGWSIPTGWALVVTDIIWTGNSARPAGNSEFLKIELKPLAGDAFPVFEVKSTVSADGSVAGNEHMTTGFVVSSTAKILGTTSELSLIQPSLYGYLIAEQ